MKNNLILMDKNTKFLGSDGTNVQKIFNSVIAYK